MSSIDSLRVIRSRAGRTAKHVEPHGEPRGSAQRRLANAHPLLLCGQSLIDNPSLIDKLESRGYRVVRHRSLRDTPSLLERDPAAVAITEASGPRQVEALET